MSIESGPTTKNEQTPDAEVINSFREDESGVLEKISKKFGKHTRALILMSTLAAGACSESNESSAPQSDEVTTEERERMKERVLARQKARAEKRETEDALEAKRSERAAELATAMGIDLGTDISIRYEGHVPTVINGYKVPEHLYTEEEREQVEAAREISETMDEIESGRAAQQAEPEKKEKRSIVLERGGSDDETFLDKKENEEKESQPKNDTLESIDIDTRYY